MDSSANGGNTSSDVLHHRFRALSMLLTLVHAINHNGCRRLMVSADPSRYIAALEEGHRTRNRILNAITTLLVRNHETIATIINASNEQVLVFQQSNISEQLEVSGCGTEGESDRANTADPAISPHDPAHTDTSVSTKHYMLVERGTSHRPRFEKWDDLLNIPENDPFVNHVATLEDTLNAYRSMGKERELFMVDFSKYIVARCWRKMYRRMTHWTSRNQFLWLFRINLVEIQTSYDSCLATGKFTVSKGNDAMLHGLLMGREEDPTNAVEDLIKQLSPFPQYHPDISKLVNAYTGNKAPKEGSQRRMGWYTKDTCIEFHKLLISALIAYTNALRIFKNLSRNRVAYAKNLWRAAYLLWRISDSRILRHHLMLLNFAGRLGTPVRDLNRDLAQDLDELYGHITAKGHVVVVDEHRKSEEADQNENKVNGEDKDDENDNKENTEGEDDDQMEECLGADHRLAYYPEVEKICLRWIQLQTTYLKAQDILTSSLGHPTSPKHYTVSLLQTKYPQKDDRTMINWTTLIKELPLSKIGLAADAVIETIKAKIVLHVGKPKSHPIFKMYNQEDFEPRKFCGNLHPEVPLALLMEDNEYVNQKFDLTFISGSELCCPVCTDVLELLRDGSERFRVRGRHSVFNSPVQLPYWTSDDIMKKMLHRYEERLVEQIKWMM